MPQAIKSDAFLDYRKVIEKANPPKDELEASETSLAHLANTDGWGELKRYIDNLKGSLGTLNKALMERGAGFEEIGRNAVVTQLAVDLLNKIVTKVEDARTAVERRRT